MSDHSIALVPTESWSFHSPDLLLRGETVDLGLMAEALIYYDRIFLNVTNQPQFAALLRWFHQQGGFDDLLAMVRDGAITIHEYSFVSAPFLFAEKGMHDFFNLQDELQAKPHSFPQRFLQHADVTGVLIADQLHRLTSALDGRVIEVKADEFGKAVENARIDCSNPQQMSRALQAFLDVTYPFGGLGEVPPVQTRIERVAGGQTIQWGMDLDELGRKIGRELNFGGASVLTAATWRNRLLWSASRAGCDLYVGQPMSTLIGDKLVESARLTKTERTIQRLEREVEFPDIRMLVNRRTFGLKEVLLVRKKAERFRGWLQTEGDRDRDALIAYHNEVAKEAGLLSTARKTLKLFGVIGGAAIGAAEGGIAGAAVGAGVGYLAEVAASLGAGWKPVVFGNWLIDRADQTRKQ